MSKGAAAKVAITVVGGGILGLWQALTHARNGHQVTLIERSATPFTGSASQWAGAMISPYCEAEGADPAVREHGLRGLQLWRDACPELISRGSLVVAAPRDTSELTRFARHTTGHELVDRNRLAELEPDLGDRFAQALWYPDEAHLETPKALAFLLQELTRLSVKLKFGTEFNANKSAGLLTGVPPGVLIDCRGLAARDSLPDLRGVRGERLLIRSTGAQLRRPVRLLHPRAALYIVPWSNGVHLIGATVIESEDDRPMTVRSALELLGLAYALHPGFGEAEIIEMTAGVRPAFMGNVPQVRIAADGKSVAVNGAYRHGFLLAPVLAEAVAVWLATGCVSHALIKPAS